MFYSVCASAVFNGTPLHEALPKIRGAGAAHYEFWGWWDQDLGALEKAQRETGLKLTAMCTKMIPLNDPARRMEFVEGLKESIAVAKQLGCSTLIGQVGAERADVPREEQHAAIVEGLRACAPHLEAAGVTLTIEPLNVLVNHKGYYLYSSAEAFEIVREAGSPAVKVLYDVYHQQITEGNLIANITANAELIGHIHIAGVPGRHEVLDGCEINYPAVLAALRRAGYDGGIGLEYLPLKEPVEGLKKLFAQIPLE